MPEAYAASSGVPAMSSLLPVASDKFFRHLFEDGGRLLIMSSCQACAEASISALYDGSMSDWERSHVCKAPVAHCVDHLHIVRT